MAIRLAKIDARPQKEQKVTLTLEPGLAHRLALYGQAYADAYAEAVPADDALIVAVVAQFLDTDPAFREYERNRTRPTPRKKRATSTAQPATDSAPTA